MSDDPLAGVHPHIIKGVQQILEAMRALGFPMKVHEGVRTEERQAELYDQGRTAPGNVVTNCDGVKHRSRHQTQADGLGHAVDCVFEGDAPYVGPWPVYGACAEALGFLWGGRFKSPVDRPHIELAMRDSD